MAILRKPKVWFKLAFALALAVFPLGGSASGGDVIESKPGGLPVAEDLDEAFDIGQAQRLAVFLGRQRQTGKAQDQEYGR